MIWSLMGLFILAALMTGGLMLASASPHFAGL